MTGMPAFLSSAVTVLLPQAMPPVSPTTSILHLLNAAAPCRETQCSGRCQKSDYRLFKRYCKVEGIVYVTSGGNTVNTTDSTKLT